MLKLVLPLIEAIQDHGARDYPSECCGAMLGRQEGPDRSLLAIVPLENRRKDSPQNRFSITPEDVLLAEKEAHAQGLDLIGWYHSHPDSPAVPSEYDREHAWPWYSYVIFRVDQRETREMRSWRLSDDRASFSEEATELIGGARA